MNKPDFLIKPIRVFIIAGLFFFMFFQETKVSADKKEIDINTNVNGYVFEVGNLKPGDWMPRDITIINNGTKDFRYMAVIGKKKSVKGLLEELDFLVKKGEDILFYGRLDDFNGFNPRKLSAGGSETLFFQVTMPNDLGNSFQSSGAEVEIHFVAEAIGESGGENPPGPPGEENPPNESEPGEDTPTENPDHSSNPPSNDKPADESNPKREDTSDEAESSTPDNKHAGSEDIITKETPEKEIKDKIVVSPEITENLLPNTSINTFNILLIGGALLGCGSTLLVFYYRRFRRDQ